MGTTVVGFNLKVTPERVESGYSGTARLMPGAGVDGFQCQGLCWSRFWGLQVTETTQCSLSHKGNPTVRETESETEKPGVAEAGSGQEAKM